MAPQTQLVALCIRRIVQFLELYSTYCLDKCLGPLVREGLYSIGNFPGTLCSTYCLDECLEPLVREELYSIGNVPGTLQHV